MIVVRDPDRVESFSRRAIFARVELEAVVVQTAGSGHCLDQEVINHRPEPGVGGHHTTGER